MSIPDASLDFRVPSQPHLSRVVREAVAGFARGHGVGEDDLTSFLTALGEALANAIEHARAESPIEVAVRVGGNCIDATVRDRGIGFEAKPGLRPALPDLHSERGRGLPIMHSCCDIFLVESVPGHGTSVRIGRYLRATSGAEASIADPHRVA